MPRTGKPVTTAGITPVNAAKMVARPGVRGVPHGIGLPRATGIATTLVPHTAPVQDVHRCRCTVCDSTEYLVLDDAVPGMAAGLGGTALWEVSYWCSQCDSYYGHTTDALPETFTAGTQSPDSLGSMLWRDIDAAPEEPTSA